MSICCGCHEDARMGDTCGVRCRNAHWSTQMDRSATVRKTAARRVTFLEKTKWTHEWIALLAKIDSVQKRSLTSFRPQNLSNIISGRVARRLPLNQHRMWLWRTVLHRAGWVGNRQGVSSHTADYQKRKAAELVRNWPDHFLSGFDV